MVVSRRPRYGATNHMRTEPRHGRRPQTYQHIIRGRLLRERLIVYRYLASHITHFFVFSTSRSNSGCGSGEHKDGRRWRSRPMANRFDTHTSWLDGWAVWNGRWELSRRPQTHGIGNEILSKKTQHAIRYRMIAPQPALGPATQRTNTLRVCSGRDIGPWSVGGALVGGARRR